MARCAIEACRRWRPEMLVSRGAGARVEDRWYCSIECIEQMAHEMLVAGTQTAAGLPRVAPIRLGTLLAARGVCNSESLSRALDAQRESGLRLGEQLRAMGAVDRDAVLTALAAQFGVRCLPAFDRASVVNAPGGLAPEAVAALSLAPISEPVEGRIRVACPAPIPRLAINALRRITGWTIEAYLVSDEDWVAVREHYGSEVRRAPFLCTASLSDAAAAIAAAVMRGRVAKVIEGRWETHCWFRVVGQGVVEDVCVVVPAAPAGSVEEAPWLAATTSR